MWVLIALIGPALHGLANILDNYLTNRLFKNVWALAFYSSLFNVLFLPLIFLFVTPSLPPVELLPFFILIALIEGFYLYPYYKALQGDDTSVVSSLFSLGKIFVPILAFLFVDERLTAWQYLGFLIIIISGAALSVSHHGKIHLNKSFFYMLGCSTLLALESVVYKYVFESVSWATGFFWTTLLSFVVMLGLLIIPKIRRAIIRSASKFGHDLPLFALEELLTFGGSAAGTLALTMASVTLVEGVESFQPFFVLFYALLFKKFFPHLFKENTGHHRVLKKEMLFGVMMVGIFLVAA